MRRSAIALGIAMSSSWLVACVKEPPPPAPRRDASVRDASMDGRMHVVVPSDGGPIAPILDGLISEDEWQPAAEAEMDPAIESDSPGSALVKLQAMFADRHLYIAIDGNLSIEGDDLIVYVDRALGEPEGVADLASLGAEGGALNAALAQEIDTPTEFRADLAFGTTVMDAQASGVDERIGWRALLENEDPTAIDSSVAPMVCSATACEAAIPLEELGGERPRQIAIFARIARAEGGLTNQRLPTAAEDDPSLDELLIVQDGRPPTPDAGVDAGMAESDAGEPALMIDGVADESVWTEAADASASVAALGPFVASSLSRLRAFTRAGDLYFHVELVLGSGHALALYVDHDVGTGFGAASPTPFADFTVQLDRALSRSLVLPADVRVDAAFGTLDMSRAYLGLSDDRMGFRDVGTDPSVFRALTGAQIVCVAAACEARIPLTALGGASGTSVALFARLVDADSDAISNQTLPLDDPGAPELVSNVLNVPAL